MGSHFMSYSQENGMMPLLVYCIARLLTKFLSTSTSPLGRGLLPGRVLAGSAPLALMWRWMLVREMLLWLGLFIAHVALEVFWLFLNVYVMC